MKTPMKSAKRIVAIVFAFSICAMAPASALAGVFGAPAKIPEVEKGASAIVVDGKTLYCGASDTLYVFDIADAPTAPRLLSKLRGFCGIRQMAIDGGLLAASARGAGVWLVDVSNPAAPRHISHYESVEQATGIELAGNFMAIGERSTGVELVDITDRAHPQHIRMVKTQESQSCRYEDGILYSGDWSSGKVNMIDVRDISNAHIVGAAEMHGLGDGFDLDGPLLYASTGHHRMRGEIKDKRHPENFGNGHGVEIWDRSNPAAPVFLSRVQFPKFWRRVNDMWTCVESGGWLFCSDTHNGLFAVDVHNPLSPSIADRFCDPDPGDGEAPSRCISYVAVGDGAVYATSSSGLWAIPCSVARFRRRQRGRPISQASLAWRDPYATSPDSHFTAWVPPVRGSVHSSAPFGNFIYAGCGYAGAWVIDAHSLQTVCRIPCAYARDVVVRDGLLYIAQGDDGLGVYSLENPTRPREIRRVREIGRGLTHCEWVYVPTPRWAVCHARRNSGRWNFLDLSKDPAQLAGQTSGMDWVKPFADELVGGRWLGYARTHRFLQWFDLSGDAPQCFDTEDPSRKDPINNRPNFIKSASCCTPISGDRLLVANSGRFILLDPAQDRNPDGSPWPTFGYENSRKVQPTGMCCWDGATRVGLAYTSGRTIQMADFADPLHPNLVWHESTAGNPENGVFDNFGRLLVPCGYQGLLVEKRIFGDDGNPRGQPQLGNKTKGNHEK